MGEPPRLVAVACGVCGCEGATEHATGIDFEYRTSDTEFRMVRCDECGNVYLNPRPDVEDLSVIYPPNYYAYNYETAVHPIAVRAKEWLDGRKVRGWLRHVPEPKPMYLDVGCGDGRYLKMLHRLGVPKERLYGVEMSAATTSRLRDEGYHAFDGRIEDLVEALPAGRFHLITLLQVIEHVEQPRAVMSALAALLADGGVLLVETPNTDSVDARLFRRRYWGGYHFPRHWNLFDPTTLRRLAAEQGLEVRAMNYLPAHSFWIFSFHHLVEERLGMPAAARFFNPLRNVALLSLFTGFDIARAALGMRTSNVQMVAVKHRPAA
jgi:SAM-dependent methyltransferase